jgi:hypothetical protein
MKRPLGSSSLHGSCDYPSTDTPNNSQFITDCQMPVPTVPDGGQRPPSSTSTEGEDGPRLLIIGNGRLVQTAILPLLPSGIADCLDRTLISTCQLNRPAPVIEAGGKGGPVDPPSPAQTPKRKERHERAQSPT